MAEQTQSSSESSMKTAPYGKIPAEGMPRRRAAAEQMAELCGVIGSLLLYLRGCPRGKASAAYLLTVARLCGELQSMALLEKELAELEGPEVIIPEKSQI